MLRRYRELKPSIGTRWPPEEKIAIFERDQGCVGPRVGMPGDCFGGLEPDHVRASHGIGMKSESVRSNGVSLCSTHHRMKTEAGKTWRPLLLDWIERRSGLECGHVDGFVHGCSVCESRRRRMADPVQLEETA